MVTVVFNALLALADGLLLGAAAKRPAPKVAVVALIAFGGIALLLAATLGENIFGCFRLLSHAIFFHGVLFLAVLAAAQWKTARKGALFSALLASLLGIVAVDAFLIEPHWLEVSHGRIPSTKLKRAVRVAVIADFQTDSIGEYEESVLRRLIAERPDLILLAGDHLQQEGPGLTPLREAFRKLIRELNVTAPLGIFAVRGNIDPQDWARVFDGLPIVAIEKTRSIDLGELRLTALGMQDSFNVNLSVPPSDRFQLVLGHSPDFALGNVQGDLLVAGHTHGGQVRIPGLGPLIIESRIPHSWAAGVTALTGGRTLVVSRGIGMERDTAPRLRFFCRPELVVIDLVPAGAP